MSRYAASAVGLAGILLCLLFLVQLTEARPPGTLSRPKRVSDQRLAELETLIALQKMRGKLVTVPIGFGKVDPMKIGRKRRSSTETSWQEISRILRSIAEDDTELSPKDRTRFAWLFSSRWNEERDREDAPIADDRGKDIGLY